MLTKMTIISCLTLNISKANTLINGTNVDLGVLEVPDEVPEEVLADLPPGCKPLGCKWIFKRKLKVDGTIEKFKSRLVIRGFRQKSGINYFDTNALVARINTVRLLIALASVHQMDVKTAFLNVVLSSGYLLNQANKYVYSKFDESGKGVIICLYVDDMLIFGTNQVQIDLTKEFLSSRFSMKDMREADVLKKFDYLNYTPMSTPMDTSEKLKPNNGKVVSQLEYSMVIGCLMYAMTCTRPDIAFAVGECIPLDSIDVFWRRLNLSPTSLQTDNICCETEINHVKEHFNKQSDAGKRSILRKLVDIFNPSKTTIKPPTVKKNTRGRPSLKKQQQNKKQATRLFGVDLNVEPEIHSSYTNNKQQERKRSYSCKSFDIDPNMQPKRHGSFSNSQRGRTQNLIPDLNEEPPNLEVIRRAKLHRQIPTIFYPYISISSLQDVKPDGNCGFRFVALGLGLHEDHWPRIRSYLVRELVSHRHQYMSIFGTKGYNQIYRSVRLAGEWMEVPATGLVIASMYNKVVVSLSNDGGCATSFPLWSDPPQSNSNEIIVIAHVNADHYIRVVLREGFPLPITHPLWVTYRSNIASEWGDRYVSRQNDFREYYFRDPESYDLT
ncbi:zinc finger, CCHC-type containing protein [Tanacetum coccineum]